MLRNVANVFRPSLFWALLAVLTASGCGKTAFEFYEEAQTVQGINERERLLSLALEKDPQLKQARIVRAWVYALDKKAEQALADYEFLRSHATSAQELGNVFYWRGRAQELNGRFEDAIKSYTAALQSDPPFLSPYLARAGVCFKIGKYIDAMQDYHRTFDLDINRVGAAARERRGQWRLQSGFSACCAGEWASAVADFREAISLLDSPAPKARALLTLYFIECGAGDKKKADEVLRSYASDVREQYRADSSLTPWIFQAVWYAAGMSSEEQFLKAAGHKSPELEAQRLTEARYYIGARQLAEGNKEKALEWFKKCIEREDLDSFEYHLAKVESERLKSGGKRAGDYLAMARHAPTEQKKIELYTEALRVNPNETDALLKRAMLYSLTGKYDLAIADCTKLAALYQRPANVATALRYRGWSYSQKGDHEAAIRDYEAASEADPELSEAREGLAVSLCRLRKYKEAVAVYSVLAKQAGGENMQVLWQLERGFALACLGEWQAAADDFAAILKKPVEAAVVRTNLFIMESKLGRGADAARQMKAYAATMKEATWETSVAWYAAEMLDEERLLKASEHSEPGVQLLRTSRAHYYIGALNLLAGDKAKALKAFEQCLELGRRAGSETWESRMAAAELAREKQ